MNFLPNTRWGCVGKIRGGVTLTPKSANFAIYTQKSADFDIFSSKNANLDNFFLPKKCNFGQFSTSKSEKYREIFSPFFCRLGKK